MRADPSIPEDDLLEVRALVARRLDRDETPLGVFAVSRFRRLTSYLVVTDQRLLTLGLRHQDHPVLDSVEHGVVDEVVLDRESMLRSGEVRARDVHGRTTYLGCLDPGRQGATLDLFEEVVEQARSGRAGMWTIPTPQPPAATWRTDRQDSAPTTTDEGAASAPPGPGSAPVVEQLAELARLRTRGLLTEEEFAEAKARVLRPGVDDGRPVDR